MTDLTPIKRENLPSLVDKAASALTRAKSSAEVLEAKELATVAYDAAKTTARIAKAKRAHDSLISEIYSVQADALVIEAQAKIRLADEYDAAQERGEVRTKSDNQHVVDANKLSVSDLGIRRDQIHEARKLRDAENEDPGLIQRTVSDLVERGQEPTKAKIKAAVSKPAPKKMDPRALWLWGRLKDFERDGVLSVSAETLLAEMTPPMRADVQRLAPLVREFIEDLEVCNV
jgi:hypothetical protein